MGLCAGVIGGLMVLVIGLLMPRKHCPNCDYKLPRFRSPKSGKQAMNGGWTCPNCGAEIDRSGNLIGERAGSPTQATQVDQSPKKTCPKCAEKIQMDARVCIHCGQEFAEADIQAARQQAEQQAQDARQAAQEKASQAQKDAKDKSHRNWSWIFAISGGLIASISACLTVALIFYAFSKEAAEATRTGGVMAVITPFLCVVPVLAIGAGLLFLGVKRLRALPKTEDQKTADVPIIP
jgi:predicted nucleic acid-binding Zn ribbon protein